MAGLFCGSMGSFISFLGSRTYVKPQSLMRKLPVSTMLCPENCGYMDSVNTTLLYDSDMINLTTTASYESPYSSSADYEMSPLQSYLSISTFYFSGIGMVYALVVGIVTSLLSGEWNMAVNGCYYIL